MERLVDPDDAFYCTVFHVDKQKVFDGGYLGDEAFADVVESVLVVQPETVLGSLVYWI